jgi:opacity protein-like surface antigen
MKLFLPAVCLVVALAAPLPAAAQDRGFVRAMVGATMVTESGVTFGAAAGMKLNPNLEIFGEFGRMQNVLPSSVLEEVERASALVVNPLGGKASSTASATASYGLLGVRRNVIKVGDAQVFVEGGAGAARVESELEALIRGSETLQGDISHLVSVPFTESSPQTKALATLGGGFGLDITQKIGVEMAYRYVRIFTDNPAINAGNLYGAVRFAF